MVLLLRGSARAVAAVLLLVSLWSLPHRSQPDICVPAGLEEHDESKHVYTAGSGPADDEHCVVCHWMRSLKPAFSASSHTSIHLALSSPAAALMRVAVRQADAGPLSPRAPPAI